MNGPFQAVLDRVEAGSVGHLMTVLRGLSDADRREVARQLPPHLTERLRGGFGAEWRVRELAPRYRLAGAACMGGAEQVAAWLNRRELRSVPDPEGEAARLLEVFAGRTEEWRKDLAVRLVGRLRPLTGPQWRRVERLENWHLAAALIVETGIEPPESDAFVSGWVTRTAERQRMSRDEPVLAGAPLLDHMVPRLFRTDGVAEGLSWDPGWADGPTMVGELAALSRAGRVPRQVLLDGCVARFLAGVEVAEAGPFVALWRELKPEVAEIPVTDFVRVLPSASAPVVRLALEELHRAEAAGALGDELFAEAVQALAFRPEKKHLTAAVKWLADTAPARAGGAVAALAPVFDVDTPSLRERAVRGALRLAPYASDADRTVIREAAALLPADLRERVSAAFGAVEAAPPEPVTAAVPVAAPLPALAPPITTVEELAGELGRRLWPVQPARYERILAALVELTHRDREAVVAGLQRWWRSEWRHPFDASSLAGGVAGIDSDLYYLLLRCAVAIVSPADARELSALLGDESRWPRTDCAPQRFVQRRVREVMSLLERGETVPVLLATPTSPTGHVDAATLLARMELLGETEPLETDFLQALLRLPRQAGQELAARAEELPSEAGRRLAKWLRDGGLPHPVVTWELETFGYPEDEAPVQVTHAWLAPPPGVPEPIAELCTLKPGTGAGAFSRDMVWWPPILPSHPEVVAAYVLECLPAFMDSTDGQVEVVAALAHGDGPMGVAMANVIVIGMGHRLTEQRALAANALVTLAALGTLPAARLGRAVGHLVRGEQVKLSRVIGVLDDVMAAGAHAEAWAALAEALPLLLPGPGEKPRAGLGDLLRLAAQAAARAGARGEVPGLAEVAGRRGSSLMLHEARRLHEVISA